MIARDRQRIKFGEEHKLRGMWGAGLITHEQYAQKVNELNTFLDIVWVSFQEVA